MRAQRTMAPITALLAVGTLTPASTATPQCPADVNGDGMVNSADISAYLTDWNAAVNPGGCPPPPDPCPADINGDGTVNSADISASLTVWLAAINVGGCPSTIALTLSGASGGLDDLITLTINPATPPHVFGPATTAQWSGRFVPLVGAPTSPFTISFSAAEVREFSASQAHIALGSGSGTFPAGIENLGPGTFEGAMTVVLDSGAIASGVANVSPVTDAAGFSTILYPDGPGGMAAPVVGPPPESLQRHLLSQLPYPAAPSTEQLRGANDFHLSAVLRIRKNEATLAMAPPALSVSLVAYDSSSNELERAYFVELNRVLPDTDPMNIIYRSDLARPILLVDTALNALTYPDFILLYVSQGGSVAIVPQP